MRAIQGCWILYNNYLGNNDLGLNGCIQKFTKMQRLYISLSTGTTLAERIDAPSPNYLAHGFYLFKSTKSAIPGFYLVEATYSIEIGNGRVTEDDSDTL